MGLADCLGFGKPLQCVQGNGGMEPHIALCPWHGRDILHFRRPETLVPPGGPIRISSNLTGDPVRWEDDCRNRAFSQLGLTEGRPTATMKLIREIDGGSSEP